MARDRRINVRVSERERAKIDECAAFMGVSSGEFMRRCLQIMLMVMGDQESKAAIHRILDASIVSMKMGAGLPPVPPTVDRVTGTHLPGPAPTQRRRKSGK